MELWQIPMVKATDIIGYDFNGSTYCDGVCILAAIGAVSGEAVDNAEKISDVTRQFNDSDSVESALDAIAQQRGIDRSEERSYDQSEFPKVVFGSSEYDYCPRCGHCEGVLMGFDPKDYEESDN